MRIFYTTVVTLAVLLSVNYSDGAIALPLEARLKQSVDPTQEGDVFILATGVQVTGVEEELQEIAKRAIGTREGSDTSNSQLQADIQAILATGLFVSAQVITTTNPTGIDVIYAVEPVVVKAIQLSNANVLSENIA